MSKLVIKGTGDVVKRYICGGELSSMSRVSKNKISTCARNPCETKALIFPAPGPTHLLYKPVCKEPMSRSVD